MTPWMTLQTLALVLDGVAAVAVLVWLWWARKRLAADTAQAREQAAQIVRHAEREADATRKEAELAAKERGHALLLEAERAARELQDAARGVERQAANQLRVVTERAALLAQRDQEVGHLEAALQQRVASISTLEADARAKAGEADARRAEVTADLQRVAGLTVDEARAELLRQFEHEARRDAAHLVKRLDSEARAQAAERARQIITEAIQRSAAERVKEELEDSTRRDWEAAAFEIGLHDVHPELLRLMGRLKFRTSYGQNVLNHSKEVAWLAGIMARELGVDGQVAVRAAFLHDIGKAIDGDMDGTHLELGMDVLRKHGERQPVLDAVAAHHMDIDWPSLEAMIVQSADAISAARPGARRDILESYVKRLEKLEDIADSFKGVSKSFALQAGGEIRILVQSEQASDEDAVWLSKDIARRIENELEYPGQIKVTVIRETRAVEIAR